MNNSTATHTPQRTVRYVVAALILRDGQILVCQRRAGQPMGLKWEFPGGKIEPGESPEEALRRELEEELGIEATIGHEVTHTRHTYRNGGAVDLRFFMVREFKGELVNRVFEEFRWTTLESLPSFDFLAADRDLVRDLANGKYL